MENMRIDEEFEETEEKNQKMQKKQPIIETSIRKSKDGKWLICKTIITDIKPIAYFEKVLKGKRFDTSGVA